MAFISVDQDRVDCNFRIRPLVGGGARPENTHNAVEGRKNDVGSKEDKTRTTYALRGEILN